ncbi:hypothetical protein [Acetobacter estunensis]|uniref:cell division protein FtsL n=1 Tax=Acetobacter estunensis TaxID=104097 RepID=UPI001C2DE5BC|nr:hypothetical protein [Acetobacter estunensis]MBV1836701.1 hypothetical protein [Acetobacter estunensis]
MFRPLTLFCALLAGSSGMFLYTKKHQTTVLDQQISKIVADTQHIRQQTAMLQTQWALLNQPDRLDHLTGRFASQLRPMEPRQFVRMTDLGKHLPAPGSFRPAGGHTAAVVAAAAVPPVAPAPEPVRMAEVEHSAPSISREHEEAPVVASVKPHKAPMVVAHAEPLAPPQPVATEHHRLPQSETTTPRHEVASSGSVTDTPAVTRKSTRHATDTQIASSGDPRTPAPTPSLPHRANHMLVADSTPVHHVAETDRTAVAHTPARVAMVDHVVTHRTTSPAPINVAAWHPAGSATPRYVEARASYSGSLLGHSSLGGGLPPPMPISN